METPSSSKTVSVKKIQKKKKTNNKFKIIHLWYPTGSIIQQYVNYAYKISSWNLDFVATLDAENWRRDMYRRSEVYKNWIREDSYWFCMIHRKRHKKIVDDKRFWSDWKRQLDQCRKLYKWWTKFYGYYNRRKTIKHFKVLK